MKFSKRLYASVAAAITFILYFSWTQPSSHIQAQIQKVWKGTAHRLVVFGDDWSDTGEYQVSPPPKSTTRDRDPDRGEMWTEWLCQELICDSTINFARSMPSNVEIATVGSVVDADIFANATSGQQNGTLALFDFKAQVQQFIAYDKKHSFIPSNLYKQDGWTIFTVLFGIWDLLEYSALDKEQGIHAIDRSIEELFNNLNLLADHVQGPLKVVVPKLVDVTFLPTYQRRKNDTTSIFAQDQHQSVFLWTYWNTALSQAAAGWSAGDVYMPDLNDIVINQVRANQLYMKKITDATGSGKQAPLFNDVKEPCVSFRGAEEENLPTAGVDKCFDPARHLFWDDMHLSGPAHQLIGHEAARLLRGNNTVNSDARERAAQGSASGRKEDNKDTADFNLKFPPGY